MARNRSVLRYGWWAISLFILVGLCQIPAWSQAPPAPPAPAAGPPAPAPAAVPAKEAPIEVIPEAPAEEEERVERPVGERPPFLPMFGSEFFKMAPETFAPTLQAPVPATYKLGPGDELKLRMMSKTLEERIYDLVVDPYGQVYVPELGEITASGMTLAELRQLLNKRLSALYVGLQTSLTLTKVRTFQVFVAGEAKRPGRYTISALSALINALYLSGGPTGQGSIRHIQVRRRDGTPVTEIDFYRYLIYGDTSVDIPLQDGDTIFLPIIGPVVAVDGEVKRPARYELLTGEEKLSEVIELAGGLAALGFRPRVKVEREEHRRWMTVIDSDADTILGDPKCAENIQVQDGDKVQLVLQLIEVQGATYYPGTYQFVKDMTVKDGIFAAGGVLPSSYLEVAHISRRTPDDRRELIRVNLRKVLEGDDAANIKLQEDDRIRVYTYQEVEYRRNQVRIFGGVQKPGLYERLESMTVRDLILTAGGLAPEAGENIEVAVPDNTQERKAVAITTLKVSDLMEGRGPNPVLVDGVVVSIPIRQAFTVEPYVVSVTGEVKYPGTYPLLYEGETLASVLARAGGLTERGDIFGIFLRRPVDQLATQATRDKLKIVQAAMDMEARAAPAPGAPRPAAEEAPRTVVLSAGTGTQQVYVAPRRVSDILADNRIPLIFETEKEFAERVGGTELKDGDEIHVPAQVQVVEVLGAVNSPGPMLYQSGKPLGYYVQAVGGTTRDGDLPRMVVMRRDGTVVRRGRVKGGVKPGDIIIIPTKPQFITTKRTTEEKIKDWLATLGDLATTFYIIRSLATD